VFLNYSARATLRSNFLFKKVAFNDREYSSADSTFLVTDHPHLGDMISMICRSVSALNMNQGDGKLSFNRYLACSALSRKP
jgi:hypothetical protein